MLGHALLARKPGDVAQERAVTSGMDDGCAAALGEEGAKKSKVLRFKWASKSVRDRV
jgi:hypothetical protein